MINLYHVKFVSPFHVGNKIGCQDYTDHFIHSDTLASAIIDTACTLYDDASILIDHLKVSSVFYCIKESNGFVYTLPAPYRLSEKEMDTNASSVSSLKNFKKRRFVTIDELNNWLTGKLSSQTFKQNLNLYVIDQRISTVIDRQTGASSPYTRASINVNPDVEGYFLADVPERAAQLLDASLNLLAHRGIGGDRSSGFGHIQFKKQNTIPEIFTNKKGNLYYTLSLYKPTEEEIQAINSNCSYKLEKRSYWFKEGQLTDRYTFFREGSLFDFPPEGQDIRLDDPSEKIIKGQPFAVGVQV